MLIINGSNKSLSDKVIDEVIQSIMIGELLPGEKVKSVREQAKLLKINPQTVQKAYTSLIEAQILVPKRGSGNFLTEDSKLLLEVKNQFVDGITNEFIATLAKYQIDKEYVIKMIKEKSE